MMKIQSWIAAAAIAAAAPSAAAQDRPAPSSSAADKIVVTGCVERADQILSRETLGTTVDSLSFVLIKAEEGKASDQPQPAAPAGQQAEGKTYRLDVDVDTINRHVGHRVEITATTTQPAPVGTSGRADAEPSSSVAPPPVLKVESVKLLSSTCGR
jgi:hypothetical protein